MSQELASYAVLVLGAGASAEFKMPLGHALKSEISKLLQFEFEFGNRPVKGDQLTYKAICCLQPDFPRSVDRVNDLLAAGREIVSGLPQSPSIDQFIFNRSGREDVAIIGKIAIARAIQIAERQCSLSLHKSDPRDFGRKNFGDLRIVDTWLPAFFSVLIDGCENFDALEARLKKIKIVSFNYDRVFLHYLYIALCNYYPKTEERIRLALRALDIIHPYGSLGPLEWQDEEGGLEFGGDLDGKSLANVSSGLLTFNESVQDEVRLAAQDAIRYPKIVMFLGFAYHDQNMRFLEVKTVNGPGFFGTASGFSEFDKQFIKSDISEKFEADYSRIHLFDGHCAKFFNEYSRALRLVGI